MEKRFIHIICCLLALAGTAALWSCEDDFNPGTAGVMDGSIVDVPVDITFDTESAISMESRAMTPQPGLSIQDMDNFWMVVYNADGSLYRRYRLRKDGANDTDYPSEITNIRYTSNSDNRLPSEGNLADDAAGHLKFDLRLPSAQYYIYGVANVRNFESKDISTRERLKNIQCDWDSVNIRNNSEMFGIFSVGQHRDAKDDSPLSVVVRNSQVQQLHCWMRRLASKITVAFDGSELFDNVQVYIDTIMICDVPKRCSLGKPNHPGWTDPDDAASILDADVRYDVENGLYRVGGIDAVQQLRTSDLSMLTPDKFYHVCNSNHTTGGNGEIVTNNEHKHSHSSMAMFFYENMQGLGKHKGNNPEGGSQPGTDEQSDASQLNWKDAKSYGTYVEVRGYYLRNTAYGTISAGWIKYRFMLGQADYNAVRNTHYKLTLKLRGLGKDYDWHVDFPEDEPGFMTASPQYISYLYNKSMYATVKVVGEMDPEFKLQATVLDCSEPGFTEWGPWGNGSTEYPDPRDDSFDGNPIFISSGLDSKAKGPATSFLSLRKTQRLRLNPDDNMQSWQLDVSNALTIMQDYWVEKNQGFRKYEINASDVEADPSRTDEGAYHMSVTKWRRNSPTDSVAIERIFRIPLYTRAKELVTKTGFTGNNPYISYPRKMTVQLKARMKTAKDTDFKDYVFNMEVVQVRRIINPKGVWRKANSVKPFHVTLLRMPYDGSPEFVSFKSIGKWSAEIVSQSDPIITLTSTPEGTGSPNVQSDVRRIEGEDERPIDFIINFKGRPSGYAIVRVRYHNYTCEHDIFCWVGMEPVQLVQGSTVRWNHANVYSFDASGKAQYPLTPLQEGSMFRRGNNVAILSTNNPVYQAVSVENPNLSVLTPGASAATTMSWDKILNSTDNNKYKTWSISNSRERIADCETDFYSVASVGNDLSFPIKKAYGILYGEGSQATVKKLTDAVGYDGIGLDNDGSTIDKGMLGVFVYNANTANTMFLPLGKAAHGRRKGYFGWNPAGPDRRGSLRYPTRSAYAANTSTPLFSDIYRRPGALYWCRRLYTADADKYEKNPDGSFVTINKNKVFRVNRSASFDINFFSMGFEGFSNSSVQETSHTPDACFIRTVCY